MDPNAIDKHFDRYKALYEDAIRKHVCERCIDYAEKGFCQTKNPQSCAVIRNLRELVHIGRAIHANRVDAYIQTLREKVCSHCDNSKPDLSCDVRKEVQCCLDRYLPLVLDALEEVDLVIDGESK